MRRLATVALIVAWVAIPSCAQRGASHGGGAVHSAPSFHGGPSGSGFHGGFSAPSAGRPSGPARYGLTPTPRYNFRPPSSNGINPGIRYPAPRTAGTAPGFSHTASGTSFARSALPMHYGNRPPYHSPYHRDRDFDRDHRHYFGGAVWPGWVNTYGFAGYPYYLAYPFDWGYDDSSDTQAYAPQGSPDQDSDQYYGPEPPQQLQPDYPSLPPWPSSNPPEPPASEQNVAPPAPAEPITIVFNDGRPPEQIRNYLLTANTLYVMDLHRRSIPIAELDLAATAKANRDAGVDFSLPSPSQQK